jgi:hypothetical protein
VLTNLRLLILHQTQIGHTRVGPDGLGVGLGRWQYPLNQVLRAWPNEDPSTLIEKLSHLNLPYGRHSYRALCVQVHNETLELWVADPARWASEIQAVIPHSE